MRVWVFLQKNALYIFTVIIIIIIIIMLKALTVRFSPRQMSQKTSQLSKIICIDLFNFHSLFTFAYFIRF